jgi:hypothetical protein
MSVYIGDRLKQCLEEKETEGYPGIAHDFETIRLALEKIAAGDGYYGMQAREYKEIARAALARINK